MKVLLVNFLGVFVALAFFFHGSDGERPVDVLRTRTGERAGPKFKLFLQAALPYATDWSCYDTFQIQIYQKCVIYLQEDTTNPTKRRLMVEIKQLLPNIRKDPTIPHTAPNQRLGRRELSEISTAIEGQLLRCYFNFAIAHPQTDTEQRAYDAYFEEPYTDFYDLYHAAVLFHELLITPSTDAFSVGLKFCEQNIHGDDNEHVEELKKVIQGSTSLQIVKDKLIEDIVRWVKLANEPSNTVMRSLRSFFLQQKFADFLVKDYEFV